MISKLIGLAVFASICFFAGFFVGEWSVYSPKNISIAVEKSRQLDNEFVEIQNFTTNLDDLKLLKDIKENDSLDQYISQISEILRSEIKLRESELETMSEGNLRSIWGSYISAAKLLLEK